MAKLSMKMGRNEVESQLNLLALILQRRFDWCLLFDTAMPTREAALPHFIRVNLPIANQSTQLKC